MITWQEFQEAVARVYEQAEGIGTVCRNVYLPDKVTGQKRQVDVLIEIEAKGGHRIRILIDAKFHQERIDVKDVESVLGLAEAVGANHSVIVAANGWTEPAASRAEFSGLDLRILTLDEALDLIVEDKWQLCPGCQRDCIVVDYAGALVRDGICSVFLAGQCRDCKLGFVWCWACGYEGYLEPGSSHVCGCGHKWYSSAEGMWVSVAGADKMIAI